MSKQKPLKPNKKYCLYILIYERDQEINGKYNDSNANKLLRLYIAIDEYNKTGKYNLKENDNEHEAQQS